MGLNHIINRKRGSRSVCLRAVGDLNFSGAIGTRLASHPDFNPLPGMNDALGKAHLGLFNLECNPVSDPKIAGPLSSMIAPTSFLDRVREEFNIAAIANNHITDAGTEAFLDTVEQLRSRDFVIAGGGTDAAEANMMRVVSENDVRIGIIACADFVYAPHRKGNHAGHGKPGVSIYEPKRIIERIAHHRNDVDVIVCSLHTGLEFHQYPDPALMRDARAMIDAGAKIILVHHAHVRQGIERYNDGLIAYGLGNFVFDITDPYMQREGASTDIGLVVDVFIDKHGIAEYVFWLSKIDRNGRTTILLDIKGNIELYKEQLMLNDNLSNPALVRREWRKVCKRYFRNRRYIVGEALKKGDFSRALYLLRDLGRRENRRWIMGLFGR